MYPFKVMSFLYIEGNSKQIVEGRGYGRVFKLIGMSVCVCEHVHINV